ncbi:hypothetical protein NUH87_28905 [Pseudomonas batumici]|uniref:hypothetical protein n=1 Tax=Pseudomonas batumici TaxID=226910 RepID=UPI0030CDAACF
MWKFWLKGLTRNHQEPIVAEPVVPLPPEQEPPLQTKDWQVLVKSCAGFDREAGLKAIRSSQSTMRLAAILERLNDWVPQVRVAAVEALDDYLTPQHAESLIAQMPAIMALGNRKRADHTATIKKVETTLAMKECLAHCNEAFWVSRGVSARFLFKVLIQTKGENDLTPFLGETMGHPDLVARQMAIAKTQELAEEPAQRVIALGLSNASGILRTQSFRAAMRFQEGRLRLIEQFLVDPSSSARSAALWAASQHGVDPSRILLERLAGDMPISKAQWLGVLGLAQNLSVRVPEQWVRPGINQRSGAVRALVLAIEGNHRPEMIVAALHDPSQAVFDVAIKGAHLLVWRDIQSDLTSRLEREWETLQPSRRRALHRLMPKWAQVQFLLEQFQKRSNASYWLEQIRLWIDEHYMIFDRLTPKSEREQTIQHLTELEATNVLPTGSLARLI